MTSRNPGAFPGPEGARVDALLDELRRYAALGVTQVQGAPAGPVTPGALEILGERVVPEAARF